MDKEIYDPRIVRIWIRKSMIQVSKNMDKEIVDPRIVRL